MFLPSLVSPKNKMYRGDEEYTKVYALKMHSSEAPERLSGANKAWSTSIIRTVTVGSGVSPDLLTLMPFIIEKNNIKRSRAI
jgi:hypothetical protein